MADTIAIMNQGVIEQLGAPQEVYDRPASVFVADFIGSPSMNFLPLRRRLCAPARSRCASATRVLAVPALREDARRAHAAVRRAARARALRRRLGAARRGAGHRVPRHQPDRHLHDARRARRCAPRSASTVPAQRGDQVGLAFDARAGVAVRRRQRPRAAHRAPRRRHARASRRSAAAGSRPWLTCSCDGIGKRFGDVQAVRDLTLDVASGEFIVLLGPSGAGKTTTLRLVAGLEKPDAGHGAHRRPRRHARCAPALRDVTFVFQQYSLYPHLSVFDNLAFPLRSPMRRTPEAEVRRKVDRGGAAAAHRRQARATRPPSCRAARCSAWRSAARWCASRRSR